MTVIIKANYGSSGIWTEDLLRPKQAGIIPPRPTILLNVIAKQENECYVIYNGLTFFDWINA